MNLKRIFLLFVVMFLLTAPLLICTAQEVSFTSCEEDAVCQAITKIKSYMEMLGAVVIGMMIVIGGFMYATGGGNEKQLSTAKSMVTCAIIGMIIILAAEIIISTIKSLLGFSS